MKIVVVDACGGCGASEWKNHEKMMRVTGQEGGVHEEIVVAKCISCGYRQVVTNTIGE